MDARHVVTSAIPARLDRLPWSRWHWRVVLALGVAWVLDGLEVTLVGSLGAVLERSDTLGLTASEVGLSGSLYVLGAVAGALVFGRAADRLGRKRLFLVTLSLYMAASLATAFAPNFVFFAACRTATGLGIGGEYAAINSAIDELVPARLRGRVNLAINGTFWLGAALGAALGLVVLDPRVLGPHWGWRVAFGLGAALAAAILLIRRHVPESPRWLLSHHQGEAAEHIMASIEREVLPAARPDETLGVVRFRQGSDASLAEVAHVLFVQYRMRAAVVLALMIAQAFLYNAIFFTYALVLTRFEGVAASRVPWYLFPFALGNVLGPLCLGAWFDRWGRPRMIGLTYLGAGLALCATAAVFLLGGFGASGLALAFCVVFFFASAAASSGYLTASEVFPLEMRGLAIALFYAVGTGVGGVIGPWLFGALIATGERLPLALGYGGAAFLMIAAGLFAWRYAPHAERRALEDVALPLSALTSAP